MSGAVSPDPASLPDGFVRASAEANGTRLNYIIGGSGEPVLLLHGWPQTSSAWRRVLAPISARGYTVIAPDLRGLGGSERARAGYEKDNQAQDVRELLRTLGLGPSVRVVGHDLGGMVAFSYARLHPEEVERLVLIELALPGFGLERAMDVARGGRWHFGFFMAPQVAELLLEGHEREFFAWWFAHLAADATALTSQVIDEVADAYRGREALRAGFEHYRTLFEDGAVNRAWAEAGSRLEMPVLAIGGAHAVGLRLAESVRAIAPGVRGISIVGSGHFVPEERPEALVAELVDFLA